MKEEAPASRDLNPVWSWVVWTIGTAGGWVIGYWLSFLLSGLILNLLRIDITTIDPTQPLPEALTLPFLLIQGGSLFISGGLIGAAQWLLVRRQIPEVGRWPLFTALGAAISLFALPFSTPLMGLGMGLLQWLLLRNVVNRAGWWALGSTGAWLLAFFLSYPAVISNALWGQLLGNAFMGLIGGALTGVILLWLLRENRELLAGLWEEAAQAEKAGKTKR